MGASGLGTLLVKEGFLTEQDRITITKTCGQGSWAFAKSILTMGLLDEDELAAFFAERTRYMVAPKNFLERLDLRITDQIDRRMVSRLEVLPLEIDHQR
jgi:energy-converting hydrogenase Eha subunit H